MRSSSSLKTTGQSHCAAGQASPPITPEWQEGERAADADIAADRLHGPYDSAEEMITALNNELED